MTKRFIATILALVTILCMSVPAMAAAPEMQKAEYEGRGYVEVDFRSKVQYKNASVTVKDPAGKTLRARITEKDDDDMTFYVNSVKPGTTYRFTISGVRKGRSGSYGTVNGSFKTPGNTLSVKKAAYDRRDGELELEFSKAVQYNNPKVIIKDAAGKTYTCRISERDRDEMDIIVKNLKSGKYTVKITGIRLKGNTAWTSVTASFQVR